MEVDVKDTLDGASSLPVESEATGKSTTNTDSTSQETLESRQGLTMVSKSSQEKLEGQGLTMENLEEQQGLNMDSTSPQEKLEDQQGQTMNSKSLENMSEQQGLTLDSTSIQEKLEEQKGLTLDSTSPQEKLEEQQQGLAEDMTTTREDKKRAMVNLISRVQDTFNGLDRYAIQLAKMKEEHLHHLAQLQDMEVYHKEMLRRLQVEHDRLLELQGDIGVQEQKGSENVDQLK
ncbi:hypothetical protein Pmani_011773 [Petrolisthes manimaculis]|uniref:Uncharacterized protein n=1 Tax=Petrolisthes manimaculis TaxID=1843537 RepID=A0AAE1UAW0_9EUCA|nr:hypothetical protein Pmani_011773 [Petrolisthes manimaculis]